jgi:putative transposase of IS4/5 family DUF4096
VNDRRVLNGIFWVLRSGAPWRDLPAAFGPYTTTTGSLGGGGLASQIDGILKAERAKSAAGDESAVDDATLNVAAHRLENLIHDRRTLIAKRPAVAAGPYADMC